MDNFFILQVEFLITTPEKLKIVKVKAEHALNQACSFLESELKHDSISYKLKIIDLN